MGPEVAGTRCQFYAQYVAGCRVVGWVIAILFFCLSSSPVGEPCGGWIIGGLSVVGVSFTGLGQWVDR